MKRFNSLFCLFVFITPLSSYAGKIPCEGTETEGCDIKIETKDHRLSEIEIYLTQDGNRLFGNPEIQTLDHLYGFYRYGNHYYFKVGDRSSNYNKQSMIFDPDFTSLSYINISSTFSPDEKDMFWGGYVCSTSDANLLADGTSRKDSSPLAWASAIACKNGVDTSEKKHAFQGNDLLFDISSFKDGIHNGNMMAILIEGIRGNNPDSYLFGCVSNCPEISGSSKFIGRIGDNIIKMFITNKESNISGHYYYYHHGASQYNKIYLDGIRENDKMTLFVKDADGKTVEELIGHIKDGGFYGEWQDTRTHKKSPFSAYQMLF